MSSAHANCSLQCLCSQQAPIFLQSCSVLPLWAFFPILGLPVAISRCLLSPLDEYTLFLTRSVQPLVSPSDGLGMCFHLLNAVCAHSQGRLLVFASVIF